MPSFYSLAGFRVRIADGVALGVRPMFVHTLTDSQQNALLSLAKQFVHADAHLAEAEENVLELLAAEAGRDPAEEIADGELDALLASFDTRQSRAVVLLELIGVGHADDRFCPAESALLGTIAGKLGVSTDDLGAMESWVQRQLSLAREVGRFWED